MKKLLLVSALLVSALACENKTEVIDHIQEVREEFKTYTEVIETENRQSEDGLLETINLWLAALDATIQSEDSDKIIANYTKVDGYSATTKQTITIDIEDKQITVTINNPSFKYYDGEETNVFMYDSENTTEDFLQIEWKRLIHVLKLTIDGIWKL